MKIVMKIGGFAFPLKPDIETVSSYAKMLMRLKDASHRLVIVAGGGGMSRAYIDAARALGESEAVCDVIGITASRLNARLLIAKLGEYSYPEPPTSIEDMRKAFEKGKIVVMGGLQPGQSTNAVAAAAAEAVKADLFINATDVNGVYTADPKKDPKAKKLDKIKADDLLRMMLAGELSAGSYELFDAVAVKIVKRSKIPTWIIDGRNVGNVERLVNGEKMGTQIVQ